MVVEQHKSRYGSHDGQKKPVAYGCTDCEIHGHRQSILMARKVSSSRACLVERSHGFS